MKKTPRVDLQNKKILFFEIGLAAALLFALLAFNWRSSKSSIQSQLFANMESITAEDEILPITFHEPPSPQEIVLPPAISEAFEIVDNTVDLTTSFNFNAEDDFRKGLLTITAVGNANVSKVESLVEEEAIPVSLVQVKPVFEGGDANTFTRWVMSRVVYPVVALENNIQGVVYLSFDIGVDGRLVNLQLVRGADPLLVQEAMRVVGMSPRWEPGKQQGKEVKVSYYFPVNFKISS